MARADPVCFGGLTRTDIPIEELTTAMRHNNAQTFYWLGRPVCKVITKSIDILSFDWHCHFAANNNVFILCDVTIGLQNNCKTIKGKSKPFGKLWILIILPFSNNNWWNAEYVAKMRAYSQPVYSFQSIKREKCALSSCCGVMWN